MAAVELPPLPEKQKTYAGIPEALFLVSVRRCGRCTGLANHLTSLAHLHFQEDVDSYMAEADNENNAGKVLRRLDEQHGKYKFMEMNISTRCRKLKHQIPDLKMSLQMIDILRNQEEDMNTQFLLSEQVFVKTTVPKSQNVCLWLGANVMLEYPLDEAEELLKQNLGAAETSLKCLEHDQDFLREQLTITEVTMARVYNWDYKRRHAAKEAAAAETKS